MEENEYTLLAGHYIEIVYEENVHRSYEEITKDINRIVKEKNACKLTINESLAKSMGFDIALYKKDAEDNKEFNEILKNWEQNQSLNIIISLHLKIKWNKVWKRK